MDWVDGKPKTPEYEGNMRLVELYLEDLNDFMKEDKNSYRSYPTDIINAARIFGEIGITFPNIRKQHLKSFVKILNKETKRPDGLSVSRLKYIFTVLNSMMEFLTYEDLGEVNVVPAFRKRYLRTYKKNASNSTPRQVPTTKVLSEMIYDIFDPKTRALHLLLAKTGIRRGEVISLDLSSVNLIEKYIMADPATKRTNRKIPFDSECADALERYMLSSSSYKRINGEIALFVNRNGSRCNKNTISRMINKPAEKHGLHNPTADRLEQHLKFGPHNYRH